VKTTVDRNVLRGRAPVPLAPLRGAQIAATQQRSYLLRRDLTLAFFAGIAQRHCVRPLLQSLAPDRETVLVPVQNFYPVLAPTRKHKQVSGEGVQSQVLADERVQTIEALAHVARRQAQIHSHAGWQVEHPRSTSSTVRRVVMSTPAPMRNRSPVANTSSS